MNNQQLNRYAPPTTDADTPSNPRSSGYLGEPQAVGLGRATAWLRDTWWLFKQRPAKWMGTTLLIFLANIVISLIPFGIGLLLQPLMMVFILAGVAYSAQSIEQRGNFAIGDIFLTGMWKNSKSLLGAGLFSIALTILYGVAVFILFGDEAAQALAYGRQADQPPGMNAMLFGFAVVYLALTFLVPTLIILQNEKLFRAIGLSLKGFLRNIIGAALCSLYLMLAGAGAIFSSIFLFGLLASPLMPGISVSLAVLFVILIMLAYLPLLFILPYVVYRDLFFADEE